MAEMITPTVVPSQMLMHTRKKVVAVHVHLPNTLKLGQLLIKWKSYKGRIIELSCFDYSDIFPQC